MTSHDPSLHGSAEQTLLSEVCAGDIYSNSSQRRTGGREEMRMNKKDAEGGGNKE